MLPKAIDIINAKAYKALIGNDIKVILQYMDYTFLSHNSLLTHGNKFRKLAIILNDDLYDNAPHQLDTGDTTYVVVYRKFHPSHCKHRFCHIVTILNTSMVILKVQFCMCSVPIRLWWGCYLSPCGARGASSKLTVTLIPGTTFNRSIASN